MVDFLALDELVHAFQQEQVPGLSDDPAVRLQQGALIARVAATVKENYPVNGMLQELKDKSGPHFYHSLRVGITFLDLVLQEKEVIQHISPHTLSVVGVLHDDGKTCVYDDILEGGELGPTERRIMKAHNRLTAVRLRKLEKYFFPCLRNITTQHHPYPRTGDERRAVERRELEIPVPSDDEERTGHERRRVQRRDDDPLLSRAGEILRICDTYDAWGSKRSYKEAFTREGVLAEFGKVFPQEPERTIRYLLERYPLTGKR